MAGDRQCLLVIGKSKRPLCFKNVQAFLANYITSKNAWMTKTIWMDRLKKWDQSLHFQQRKVALLIDNCTAYCDIDRLTNIEVMMLPVNTTSLIQSCDMGIIRTLKAHCRHEIRARIAQSTMDVMPL